MVDEEKNKKYYDDVRYGHEDDDLDLDKQAFRKGWAYKYMDLLRSICESRVDLSAVSVLDVGCKDFFTYDYFLENFDNEITGIDLYDAIFDFAKEKNKPILNVDAHRLLGTFDKESLDLILGIHSFEHMLGLPLVIENCYQVLKKGGHIFCVVPLPSRNLGRGHWYDILDSETFINLFHDSGFELRFTKVYNRTIRPEVEIVGLFQKV